MTINEIRRKYLDYFAARGHVVIPSASLIPQNDPTTLFNGSGMQPLVPYLLGQEHPKGARLANSQKSFRAEDIEEVGDNRHTTFFEMLGNWSLGDYFKEEQLRWVFGFLVDELGIDPSALYVTAFIGDEGNGIPRDSESAEIWQRLFAEKGIDAGVVEIGSEQDGARLGMRGGRIFFYDAKKNWWSRSGTPEKMPPGEPGGPDSEIFYDFDQSGLIAHDPAFGAQCHPNCDCGRFMEIGNSVFMQYIKGEHGRFELLPKRNVDFGGGLERIGAAVRNDPDIFTTDVFADIIALLEEFSGKRYADSRYQKSFRIAADHMRAATFILGDGVRPGNAERGYMLRRLLRRASRHAQKLGLTAERAEDSMLVRAATIVLEKYAPAYPEFGTEEMHREITDAIWNEEVQFGRALAAGVPRVIEFAKTGHISGAQAFQVSSVMGVPFEMIQEIAREYNADVDEDGYRMEMEKHREISRSGSEQKFKGGLADTSLATTRLHTAHHLLLKALQIVLGEHVKQRGSNITQERLRIDFAHGTKMSAAEIAEVERIVNAKIKEELPVIRSMLPKEEAEQLGAQHEFGAKYPDVVSVYSVGPKEAMQDEPHFAESFSIEFCGGPHVANTGEIAGTFKIVKEEAVASGIRRIKAIVA